MPAGSAIHTGSRVSSPRGFAKSLTDCGRAAEDRQRAKIAAGLFAGGRMQRVTSSRERSIGKTHRTGARPRQQRLHSHEAVNHSDDRTGAPPTLCELSSLPRTRQALTLASLGHRAAGLRPYAPVHTLPVHARSTPLGRWIPALLGSRWPRSRPRKRVQRGATRAPTPQRPLQSLRQNLVPSRRCRG